MEVAARMKIEKVKAIKRATWSLFSHLQGEGQLGIKLESGEWAKNY